MKAHRQYRNSDRSQKDASTSGTVPHPSLSPRWIIDSGSSEHMSPDFAHFFEDFPISPEPFEFGKGVTGYALGQGTRYFISQRLS